MLLENKKKINSGRIVPINEQNSSVFPSKADFFFHGATTTSELGSSNTQIHHTR